MAEKSITCPPRADPPVADDTFDRLEFTPGPAIRISLDVNSNSGIPVMGSCRHCKVFFGRYASSVCIYKVNKTGMSRYYTRKGGVDMKIRKIVKKASTTCKCKSSC